MGETCISRCYYAAYHLVAALLESRGGLQQQRWRHERLVAEFGQKYARRGFLFSKRDVDILGALLNERYRADYGNVRFTQRQVGQILEATRLLCRRLLEEVGRA